MKKNKIIFSLFIFVFILGLAWSMVRAEVSQNSGASSSTSIEKTPVQTLNSIPILKKNIKLVKPTIKQFIPKRTGILSIYRNGKAILRDTIVKSVDSENYTMVVNVWGIDLKIEYGNALVVPGVTNNYNCPGMVVKNCKLKNEPNALFFKEGDRVNVTGIVKTTSTNPITIEARRIYNDVFAKPLPYYILKKRIGKIIKNQLKNNSNLKEISPIKQGKPVKKIVGSIFSQKEIENKINEILRKIADLQNQIKSKISTTSSE